MSKVFDCFLFDDEADALEIRLAELDAVVDCFVLCEWVYDASGQTKPLYFLEQRERFAPFSSKIKHVILEDPLPEAVSAEDAEAVRWNALESGLTECEADDLIIVSDVTEIPRADSLGRIRSPLANLQLTQFRGYLNLRRVGLPEAWHVGSATCRFEFLRSPQWLRGFRHADHHLNQRIKNAGWHFAALGRGEAVKADQAWQLVPLDESFPQHVRTHLDRYQHLVGPPLAAGAPIVTDAAPTYYENSRPEVLDFIPFECNRVLELGCANGALAAALKARQQCHVTGVEHSSAAAEHARTRLDLVLEADCESLDLDAHFRPEQFDCLIAADVLEHLREPEALLRRLQPYLTPEAAIVISIPNVRHGGVLRSTAEGYWSYQEEGILDRTHLRFFTRREIELMFVRLGFEIEQWGAMIDPKREDWARLGKPKAVTFGPIDVVVSDDQALNEFFVVQWLARARSALRPRAEVAPTSPPAVVETIATAMTQLVPPLQFGESALAQLTGNFVRVSEEFTRTCAELRQAEQRSRGLQAELDLKGAEIVRLERDYEQLAAELAQEANDNHSLRAERDAARNELRLAVGSITWRSMRPVRALGRRSPGLGRLVRGARTAVKGRRNSLVGGRSVLAMSSSAAWFARRIASNIHISRSASHLPVLRLAPQGSHKNVVFKPRRIGTSSRPRASSVRRRIVCLTHVLPHPPRAGNEYRIDRMLRWLASEGWDITLLIGNAPHLTERQIIEASAVYPDIIVCMEDGELLYTLPDNDVTLQALREQRPRTFKMVAGDRAQEADFRGSSITQFICPDLLVDTLLHLLASGDVRVVMAEYVFMARPFSLLPDNVLKIIDTHDVFSTRHAKVALYGVDEFQSISRGFESELLKSADAVIAIQPLDYQELRALAPDKKIVTVGVDFDPPDDSPVDSPAPAALMVGSGNPANVKGVQDFLRFAWPLVRQAVPDAELHIVGSVAKSVDFDVPGVHLLGLVDDLSTAYRKARVVINPCVAGTGLKIKTLEALCHLRPVVVWPCATDGLSAEAAGLCYVATNWFDFAENLTALLLSREEDFCDINIRLKQLAREFDSAKVYAPLREVLGSA